MSQQSLWGIDLGGTKIEGVVLESNTQPNVLSRVRIATEGTKGYGHVLDQIKSLVQDLINESGLQPASVGIGTPGALDPSTRSLRGCNSQHLNGKPLREDLESLLGIPIAIENDANCFALAETKIGVVREHYPNSTVVFGVIMGTGVGGGLVVNGELISGPHSLAGEWGHNFLHHSGQLCYCGKSGCVETILSGPALEDFYTKLTETKLSLVQIVELANKGDDHAKTTMRRLIKYFGLGISSIVNVLDPDVIIIGGGVGNIDALYTEGVVEVSKHTFAQNSHTKIVKPSLGDSAGVFGAAYLIAPSSS